MARLSVLEAGGANILAFLDMIAHSEIGDALLLASDDGYNVLVGSTVTKPLLFKDYSKHPRILNKQHNSTAAGRYQIIWPTWSWLLSGNGLMDFSPENQDRGCIELLRSRNAYEVIANGDIEHGIYLCRNEWASFPGNDYGQHQNKLENLLAYHQGAVQRYV